MPFRRLFASILLLVVVVFCACKRDFEKPKWDTNILAPFAYTELSIEDIVKNNGQINSDKSVDLFIRDSLYTLKLDELIRISTPPFDIGRTLDSIRFDTEPIETRISLGAIAIQMQQDPNPSTKALGDSIIAYNGRNLPLVPPISNLTGGPIPINISTILEEADIKTGFLDIKVKNELPIAISRVEFKIANASTPATALAQPVMTNITTNNSKTHTENIAGKHVEGAMRADIIDLDFGLGFNVHIDTSKAIIITMSVREVTVSSAVAVFPAQNVVNDKSVTYLQDMGSVQLKKMIMKSGAVNITVSSTVPETLYFSYDIPGAKKNGVPFHVDTEVPPDGGTIIFSYDMTDYVMDLSGSPLEDTSNALYSELVGKIKYTGNKIPLSLDDSLHVTIAFDNAVPSYVEGYLGNDTFNFTGSVPLTAFNNITGNVEFESAKVSVLVENAFGAKGLATINSLKATNSAGNTATVSSTPTILRAATNGTPPTVPTDSVNINNAAVLFNLLPNNITYNARLQLNPSEVVTYNQFAYADYPVKTLVEFKMPLSLIADTLKLKSAPVTLSSVPELNTALKKGKINLIADNGFPFAALIKVHFLDGGGNVMQSLTTNDMLLAAPKGPDKKVTESKRSVVSYDLAPGAISNIQNAKAVIFEASFLTVDSYSKVYSDYKIKFKLAGDIQYTVNAQQ